MARQARRRSRDSGRVLDRLVAVAYQTIGD
jgi:hypothetical protein